MINIKPWIRNNMIKRGEYLLYCGVPTSTLSSNDSSSATKSFTELVKNFDLATASLDTLGLGSFVIGATVFAWCKIQEVSTPKNELITRGFYSVSRNPMAMSCMLSLIGACLLTHNPYFAIAISSIGWASLNFYQIPIEEKELLEKFGDEYKQYMAKTNRWITFSHKKSNKS